MWTRFEISRHLQGKVVIIISNHTYSFDAHTYYIQIVKKYDIRWINTTKMTYFYYFPLHSKKYPLTNAITSQKQKMKILKLCCVGPDIGLEEFLEG